MTGKMVRIWCVAALLSALGSGIAAAKQADGTLLAIKIEVIPPRQVLTSLQGEITSIGNQTFMVAGTTIVIDSQTVIASEGKAMGFAELKIGAGIALAGTRQSDNSILAVKIEIT